MSNYTEIKKSFNKNGYAVLRNFIPKKLIDEIQTKIEDLIKKKLIKNKLRDIHYLPAGQLSSVHNITGFLPEYKKFRSNT